MISTFEILVKTDITEFSVNSSTPFSRGDYIQIDDEKMLIRAISGNRLTVRRGEFGSLVMTHDTNIPISVINVQDDTQVIEQVLQSGDDFGFGETVTDYADGQQYSTSQQRDVET